MVYYIMILFTCFFLYTQNDNCIFLIILGLYTGLPTIVGILVVSLSGGLRISILVSYIISAK